MLGLKNSDVVTPDHVTQDDVIAFLSDKDSYPWPVDQVSIRETHGALIFLAGDYAVKIKKAVCFPYMDFSTLEKREAVCQREVEINKKAAPQIYIGVKAITLEASGCLAFAGDGNVVEWSVLMKRFDEDDVLSSRLACGQLSKQNIKDLAETIAEYHSAAPQIQEAKSVAKMRSLIDQVVDAFQNHPQLFHFDAVRSFDEDAKNALGDAEDSLHLRAEKGFVRRCHGDLHLNNIVLIDEKPVLFDAIEFDEELASIDTFYDLAFLIMDMIANEHDEYANRLFNRYLISCQTASALCGIKAMPLFLALRAAIRAMVLADRSKQESVSDKDEIEQALSGYFELAQKFLVFKQPVLIAVGGLSGTGKSTLAASLAPVFGTSPGAVHLRSDLERKAFAMVQETERLPEKYYAQEISNLIYSFLSQKSRLILNNGYAVIVDAVYLKFEERRDIAAVASALELPFIGLWLKAPDDVMKSRVTVRSGDASDATADVVNKQLKQKTGPISWHVVNAAGNAKETLAAALAVIAKHPDIDVTQNLLEHGR